MAEERRRRAQQPIIVQCLHYGNFRLSASRVRRRRNQREAISNLLSRSSSVRRRRVGPDQIARAARIPRAIPLTPRLSSVYSATSCPCCRSSRDSAANTASSPPGCW
jgi:hypothetical protein